MDFQEYARNEESIEEGYKGMDQKTKSLGITGDTSCCSNCNTMRKSRRRQFSEQAWTVLLLWDEVSAEAVDKPICQDCYEEIRDVLIDRAEDVEAAVAQQADELDRIRQQLGSIAS